MPSFGSSQLYLGDNRADAGIPAGELDARCLADDAASAVAADEIQRLERRASGDLDLDAGLVLFAADHLPSSIHRDT
jgi:hypothetical protein